MAIPAFNGSCLWVRGIPMDCQREDLLKIFRSYGRVANVHIPNEPLTRCHKGYAFVTMTTSSEAQDCIRALHGAELGGYRLLVEVSKRSTAYAKTPGVYLGKSTRSTSRPAEPGLLRDEAALAEPLSEPASAATFAFPAEPMEPGGEPLTEEDPVPSVPSPSPFRRCEDPPMPLKSKEVAPAKSPRSRISQLEAANVRAAAQQTADSLLLQFQRQGFADPHHAAAQCLQRSLELLGSSAKEPFGPLEDFSQRGPQALVAPDEFKNPSTFLRVYGDPAAKGGLSHHRPESMQDGNWRCDHCSNVNFPRRQRCNKCQGIRGPAGDAIVLQYAARVYEMLKGKA